MSATMNKVIILGNVGKDPEIRETQDGRQIANLVIATTESWKDKITGERKEKTEWHKISIFPEGLVNIVKNYVKKGSKLYIEGSIQTKKWKVSETEERYSTEIVVQNYNGTLLMLDSKNGAPNKSQDSASQSSGGYGEQYSSYDNNVEEDDGVPF